MRHGVGKPWKYVAAIVERLKREKSEHHAIEERRRQTEREESRKREEALKPKLCEHGVAPCAVCNKTGFDMLFSALGIRRKPVSASEQASRGVALPHSPAADVAPEGVSALVASNGHDGVLTPAQPSSGGAEASPQRVTGVAALETGGGGHAGDGFADVAGAHGVSTEVPMPVNSADEGAGAELADLQPRPDGSDGASNGVTLVRDANEPPLPNLVSLPPGECDEEPLGGVLDVLNPDPREVITPRPNDKPERENEPVTTSAERVGKTVGHSEHVSGFQRLCLLLGLAKAVPDAGKDVSDQSGTGGALKALGPVSLGDGGHLTLNGGHLVAGGAQVRDVTPDRVHVRGERLKPGGSAPQPETLQVQPVGLPGGIRPGAGGELVRLRVQTLQIHGLTKGVVFTDDGEKGGVGHVSRERLNVQAFKPSDAQDDHSADQCARPKKPEDGPC